MTNAELIARLQELPPDLPVRVGTADSDGIVTGAFTAGFVSELVWGDHIRLAWAPNVIPEIPTFGPVSEVGE